MPVRLEQLTARAGFVRPRFDDGTFDDPLPLRDSFEERFLAPGASIEQLALIGPRGSGLTTTLAWLHALTGQSAARVGLTLKQLLADPGAALALLEEGRGILFLDTSVTPIAPRAWRLVRRLFSRGLPGHAGSADVLRGARLVVTRPGARQRRPQGDWPAGLANPQRAYLSPWSDDDLLELLGARPDYRERRTELFAALRAVRGARDLLGRPRTARWLVEAALRQPPGAPLTLTGLYGEVLARLSPQTRALLALVRRDALGPKELQQLLTSPPRHLEEVATLFELPRALANVLRDPGHDLVERAVKLGFLSPEVLRLANEHLERGGEAARRRSLVAVLVELGALSPGKLLALSGQVQPDLGQGTRVSPRVHLALPGLQHCLAARDCLEGVRAGRAPEAVEPEWFPFLREESDAVAQRRLVGWLRAPELRYAPPGEPSSEERPLLRRAEERRAEERPLPRDASAATLLWVSGITPPLDAKVRPLDLRGAHLAGLSFPGVTLRGSDLSRADLGQARLEGADLREAWLRRTRALNAALDGADLGGATLLQARLERVSLRGARLVGARATRCRLRDACLEGAQAQGAWLDACTLTGADLTRADLSDAHLVECELERANLSSVVLDRARLLRVDLRRARVSDLSLRGAVLTRCALSGLRLPAGQLARARLQRCELTGTDLRGGDLEGARLDECWLGGAELEGACLRGAELLRVSFGGCASLRGADLRGATLRGTDLRGVDLRGALLDERLRLFAQRTGALL